MQQGNYTGQELVTLVLEKPFSGIHIHSSDPLQLKSASLQFPKTADLKFFKGKFDKVAVVFGEELSGEVKLLFTFGAELNWSSEGFYLSSLTMASTHFEPIYARQALPCFDEPNKKAVFKLSASVEEDYCIVSNTEATSTHYKDGRVFYEFEETPLMPVYLLHWSVLKQEVIQTKSNRGVSVSVYTPTPQYAEPFLHLAKEALEYFEEYFEVPYPLKKLDLVSVPSLKMRAMENWGAITFNSNCIKKTPEEDLQTFPRNARTVCHEVSHMWFGNLVTMDWWTHIWLNEGFARFIEHKCLDYLRPDMRVWVKFLPDVFSLAQTKDVSNTHPIEIECSDPNAIGTIFDAISYAKGASVVRMLEDFMGEQKFKEGIQEYLRVYAYKNTTTEMLWEVLAKHSSCELGRVMNTWTSQEGFPYLTLEKLNDFTYNLSQKRFSETETTQVWEVPVKFLDSNFSLHSTLLSTRETQVKLSQPSSFLKLNYQTRGFYRVLYSRELFSNICRVASSFPVEDRFGLLSDTFEFAKLKKVETNDVFALINAFLPEYEFIMLKKISEVLLQLIEAFSSNYEVLSNLLSFTKKVCKPVWKKYKLSKQEPFYDFNSMLLIAYGNLCDLCRDKKVSQKVLSTYESGQLRAELTPLVAKATQVLESECDLVLPDPETLTHIIPKNE